jgi:hypothetical protein
MINSPSFPLAVGNITEIQAPIMLDKAKVMVALKIKPSSIILGFQAGTLTRKLFITNIEMPCADALR